MRLWRNLEFWASVLIVLATVCLMVADNLHWVHLGFFAGQFRLNHWFVWIGTLYIAFAVPAIAISKRKRPSMYKILVRVHVFGNLLAFLLISLHFAGQIDRPAQFYPQLGTGLALYIVMIFLTATGFSYRFKIIPSLKIQTNRFVHISLAMSFYTIIVIHILHGLGII